MPHLSTRNLVSVAPCLAVVGAPFVTDRIYGATWCLRMYSWDREGSDPEAGEMKPAPKRQSQPKSILGCRCKNELETTLKRLSQMRGKAVAPPSSKQVWADSCLNRFWFEKSTTEKRRRRSRRSANRSTRCATNRPPRLANSQPAETRLKVPWLTLNWLNLD